MKIYYKIKKTFFNKSFLMFAIIGVINTFIYTIYYIIFLEMMGYILASIISFIIMVFCSFFLNCEYNFKINPDFKKFFLFPISYIPPLITQTIGLAILVEHINMNKELSGLLASLIGVPISFIIAKYFLK